ncbi:cytochrome protein [Xylaria sp. FL0043]|nr:cytochrome protein [Xylaria sp. FL0043]
MATIEILWSGILLAAALSVIVKIVLLFFEKGPGRLPPGPKGLPFLGNILDLPHGGERECEHWVKHKDTYGPISSITALGQTIVILHSPQLASELFEKRSSKYSSRASFVFADMIGFTETLPLMPYNSTYRARRKLTHMLMGTKTIIAPYLALQDVEVHRFLFRTLREPDSLLKHIRTEAAAIILKIVYGYTVESHKPDPLVELVDTVMEQFSAATVPGAWLVDIFPALKYVPEWMPGGRWKRTAREWQRVLREVSEKPLQFARRRIASGNKDRSFVMDFHNDKGDNVNRYENDNLKWSAFTTYGGGADTTVNTISSFFLAMTLFPNVQRRAQEEIDRVVGVNRLPTFGDRESLPYVEAVLTEAWRWHSVAPMGVAHAATAEDVVEGYRIPKGTLVLPNTWWFMHDPAVYPDPMAFDPSRYLGQNPAPDPANHIFGYGRRICPGRYIADSSVWLTIVRSLAVFDISKGLDENGCEIEPTVKFTPGIISRPEEFKATIKPRSRQHEALIRQVEELHPWEESGAAELQNAVI